MDPNQISIWRRVSLAALLLVAWVGIAVFLTFDIWPSRTSSVTRPIAAAPSPSEAPPAPSFILTQFVAGGPLTLATQAPNGSLVVVTQYSFEPLVMHGPDRYYTIDPDGTQREVSLPEFQRRVHQHRVPGDVRSLGLFDYRYQPDINLDDLK